MNNSYQQLTTNLEYLKLKQMAQHLGEVVDFSINNQLSFVEALVKLTNYEIDVR
ncbi:IS21-like element ISCbo2 family helper ATPase IstB, partial [Bacillus cereus group sp. MYBK234-1]